MQPTQANRPVEFTQASPSGTPRPARENAFPTDEHAASSKPLRVLLVEDSALLVQRIRELVDELPAVELVGIAATEADALALLAHSHVHAVILDLQLHTGSGFGILRALRGRAIPLSVIVFTNFAIAAYRETAFALGASHFLDKSRDYDRLPAVLQELSDSVH